MWCACLLFMSRWTQCSSSASDWACQVAKYGAAFISRVFDLQIKDSEVHRVLVWCSARARGAQSGKAHKLSSRPPACSPNRYTGMP